MDTGEPPAFEPFGDVATCPVDRLSNAGKVRLFVWEDWNAEGLERGVLTQYFDSGLTYFSSPVCTAFMETTDEATRLGLTFRMDDSYLVLFVRGDGWVVDAFRFPATVGCLGTASQTAGRHAMAIGQAFPGLALGGVIVDETSPASPTAFQVDPTPLGAGPAPTALGTTRWGWRFVSRIDALSAIDGSGYVTLSPNGPGVIDQVSLISTGPEFFWNKLEWNPATQQNVIRIHRSDGVAPSMPYFEPDPLDSFAAPAYAHTHLGMMRGHDNSGVNAFAFVEIWATPYSPGTPPSPYKVGDYAAYGIPITTAGGYGRFLAAEWNADNPSIAGTTHVWDLVTLDDFTFQLPDGLQVGGPLGATPTHAYVVAHDKVENKGRFVVRQKLPW